MDEITLEGKKYISARLAAKRTGYARDYIGQMCRSGQLPARMVGRNWYVEEGAANAHRKSTLRKAEGDGVDRQPVSKTVPKGNVLHAQHSADEKREQKSERFVEPPVARVPETASKRLTLADLATRKLSKKNDAPPTSVQRPPRVVEEAFPLRYEVDERPLIPNPTRRERTSIVVGDDDHGFEQQRTHPMVSTVTQSRAAALHPTSSPYVADARAVRWERYGPPSPQRPKRIAVQEDRQGTVKKEKQRISPRQESVVQRERRSIPRGPLLFATLIGVIALGILIVSVTVGDNRSYIRDGGSASEPYSSDIRVAMH